MSNDRLWIQCTACGEKILLAKYWGDRAEVFHPQEKLNEWLTDHTLITCDKGDGAGGLKPGAECFKILTEADPED